MRHESIVFFLDRTLGRNVVASALRSAGATVEVHANWFAPDCPDADWLTEVGRRGWVVVTQDKAIRRRDLELLALRRAKIRAFILTSSNVSGSEIGGLLARHLPAMMRIVQHQDPPFVALISREGVKLRPV